MTTALHSYDPALAGELDDFLEDATAPAGFYRDPPEVAQLITQVGGEQPVAQRRPPWAITDDDACDWAMRKVVRATERLDEVRMLAEDRIATIRAWYEQQRKGPESAIDFFSALLKDYALEQRAATNGARKSVSVPSGVVSTSQHSAAVELADADLLLDWLETHHHDSLLPVWCQIEPKPLISRIRPEVAIKTGSVCKFCHHPIVSNRILDGQEPLRWHSVMGPECEAVPVSCPTCEGVGSDDDAHFWCGACQGTGSVDQTLHAPSFGADGEMVEVQVATATPEGQWTCPVPGLSVRPESVSATVKPALP